MLNAKNLLMAAKCAAMKLTGESAEECACAYCAAVWRWVIRGFIVGLPFYIFFYPLLTGYPVNWGWVALCLGFMGLAFVLLAAANDAPKKG